jgi:DNA-binding CsgD family transcriptional regulator
VLFNAKHVLDIAELVRALGRMVPESPARFQSMLDGLSQSVGATSAAAFKINSNQEIELVATVGGVTPGPKLGASLEILRLYQRSERRNPVTNTGLFLLPQKSGAATSARLSRTIHSIRPLASRGHMVVISLSRDLEQEAFTEHEVGLVDLVQRAEATDSALNFPPTRSLSNRERDVLEGLCDALSDKEIAARLSIKTNTVHFYVTKLYRRFGVTSRAGLVRLCVRNVVHEPSAPKKEC